MSACEPRGHGEGEPRVVGGRRFGGGWLCVVDTVGGDGGEEKQGGYEKRGRSGERSLLPSLCARNINDSHFSPDTGANPRRAHFAIPGRAGDAVLLFIARFAPLDSANKSS